MPLRDLWIRRFLTS
uniref:Uncharacterized protein n=1 Tax=Arundo donax TaxID=35708 RepID=A0A0A9AEZ1_ARUDO